MIKNKNLAVNVFSNWNCLREKNYLLNNLTLFFLLYLVLPLIEDADTEAEVVRLIVAIRGRALVHDRPIVGVTDPNRSLDQSRRRSRRRSRRKLRNPTRKKKKKVITLG